jgi:hypothetical protein
MRCTSLSQMLLYHLLNCTEKCKNVNFSRSGAEVPHRPGGLPGSDLGTVLEGIGAGSGQATG